MKQVKYTLAIATVTIVLSSCGIFKKDCNCPHFSHLKPSVKKAANA
ncbi:hypothetical protein ACVW0P_003150 [Mucilaginibacter sp. UYNi724]